MGPRSLRPPSVWLDVLRPAGRALAQGGRWLARKAANGYRAVDPDVPRHLIQMPLAGLSMLASGREHVRSLPDDGHRPLIFVHGLGGHRGNFLPMAAYLRMFGRTRAYRIHFPPDRSIPSRARALARFVRRVRAATGARKVDVVAHSLGGLVARLAVADHGLARSIHTLVMLGTPHAGTYAARYANTRLTRELRPDSALIRRLNRTPLAKSIRGVSFWSRSDLIVVPAESAALAGTRRVDLTPFTHLSYLLMPRGWESVRQALA